MIPNHPKPPALLVVEAPPAVFLVSEPVVEALTDLVAKRYQLVILVERVPNERDDVGQASPGAGSTHLVLLDELICLPELLLGPISGRRADAFVDCLDVFVVEALAVGLGVEELECVDFVFVVVQKLLERLDETLGLFLGLGRETGFGQLVLADLVDDLFEGLLEIDEQVAEIWVGRKRFGGGLEQLFARCRELFLGGFVFRTKAVVN